LYHFFLYKNGLLTGPFFYSGYLVSSVGFSSSFTSVVVTFFTGAFLAAGFSSSNLTFHGLNGSSLTTLLAFNFLSSSL